MSLDSEETKNKNKNMSTFGLPLPKCRINIRIRSVGNFIDNDSIAFDMNDNFVRITNRDSWAAVFTHGLSVEKEIRLNRKRVAAKASIPVKDKDKKKQEQKMFDYDGIDAVLGKFSLKPAKKRKEKKPRVSAKKLAKRLRSRARPMKDDRDCVGHLSDPIDPVYDEKEYYEGIGICDCCGVKKHIYPYRSIYSPSGTKMRGYCVQCECCPGRGWESGGSLCRYCRSECW